MRAYYALGRVQAAESEPLKGDELAKALQGAVDVVQKGIALATELGHTHRFLVYNGSVHVYRIARPLLSYSGDVAATLATTFESITKRLKDTEQQTKVDADWRLQLTMTLAGCLERSGKKKDAAALLTACSAGDKGEAALVERCDASLAEQLVQLQAHMLLDDAGALTKLRSEAATSPRRRALVLTQLMTDGGPPADPKAPFDFAGECDGAIAALDPDLGAALATEGGEEAVRKAVLQTASSSSGCADDDLLIMLATQAASNGLLKTAEHCATRCASCRRRGGSR